MKGKQHKLGTESCLTAGNKSENWGGITVFSSKFMNSRS